MVWILPIVGLMIGIALGLITDIQLPSEYSNYLLIAILACLDSLFGGVRAYLQNIYDEIIFITGFLFNMLLAISLAFLGVHLGVDLYLVAVFAFGMRLFRNIAVIRRMLISKWQLIRKNAKKS
ncbi:small basic family protein [Bacillus carboniphilus]|uniref:Small basic family protein n=1 Tax=Bacillus carboniphilus TaxID=86663 RepID=A0ABY9JXW1_9BACI|nr:small basic family protein [Bacillus carboniphilus]WLR43619.1 small basic family protein [Bacillus carboniphilus]